jgi:hypothetical protein
MAGCLRSAVPLALRSNLIETIGGLRRLIEKLQLSIVRGMNHVSSRKAPDYNTRQRQGNL